MKLLETPTKARCRLEMQLGDAAASDRASEHGVVLNGAMVRHLPIIGMSFRERLEVVLRDLGAKFGVRDTRGVLLMPELAHADLADMIGSSRPMVSRLIAEMTEERFLIRQGKQFILLDALLEEKSDSLSQRKENRAARKALPSRLR